MLNSKFVRLLAALLALSLIAAACGDSDDASDSADDTAAATTEAPTTTEAADDDMSEEDDMADDDMAEDDMAEDDMSEDMMFEAPAISIGYLLPQTGGLSVIVDALVKPLEMLAAEANEHGGNVTLVPGDSGTDPNVASASVDQLLNDDVSAIMGAAASGVSTSVLDKITGSQVVQCSGSNTAASLSVVDDGGFYFRTAPSDVLQGPALADLIADDGGTTVGVVFRNDEYGAGFAEVLTEGLEANGLAVAASVAYDPEATSFDAEAGELAAAGLDAVVVVAFAEGAQLFQAMIEAGVGPADVATYVTDGVKDSVSWDAIDPDNPAVMEGIRGTAPSAAPANGEATFGDRFAEFAPDAPNIFSAQFYDCMMVTLLASAVAGSADPADFVSEMIGVTSGGTKCTSYHDCIGLIGAGEDIDYDGASGPLEFGDNGEPTVGTYDLYEYDAEGAAITFDQLVLEQ